MEKELDTSKLKVTDEKFKETNHNGGNHRNLLALCESVLFHVHCPKQNQRILLS